MRKFWFAYLAKALVVFPGGFGTLDEMFEILTLVQTDKLSKKIGVVLYGREYWEQVLDLKPMAEWGAIAEKDLELLHYADTPAEAFELPARSPDRASPRAAERAGSRDARHREDALSRECQRLRSVTADIARAVRRERGSTGASHEPAISRAVSAAPRFVRAASSIPRGCRSAACLCSYSYGGSRQPKRSGSRGAERGDQRDAGFDRAERLAIEDVDLAAAAAGLRVLVERRLEHRPAGRTRRAARARSAPSANAFRVHPRRAEQLERLASCRALPRRWCPRTAPCRDRRSPSRASGCSATAARTECPVGVEVHVAAPAFHRHDLEVGADAELLVEQPRQLADGHAVPHRQRDTGRRTTRSRAPASALRPRCRRSGSADRRRSP